MKMHDAQTDTAARQSAASQESMGKDVAGAIGGSTPTLQAAIDHSTRMQSQRHAINAILSGMSQQQSAAPEDTSPTTGTSTGLVQRKVYYGANLNRPGFPGGCLV